MSEIKVYRRCMDSVHAPEALRSEVLHMTQKEKTSPPYSRRVLLLAAVAVLLLALGVSAYAGQSIYGWGGNVEIRTEGDNHFTILHTDSLTEPVEFQNGRMIFIVNGETLDITDRVSETRPFTYAYTDAEGIRHFWAIGLNGPELTHYGYAEYLYKEGENWIGGYSARTNLDPDNPGPGWLEAAKVQFGIPW